MHLTGILSAHISAWNHPPLQFVRQENVFTSTQTLSFRTFVCLSINTNAASGSCCWLYGFMASSRRSDNVACYVYDFTEWTDERILSTVTPLCSLVLVEQKFNWSKRSLCLFPELISGTPSLKINHGSGTLVLQLTNNIGVADRRWHRLDVRSNSKVRKVHSSFYACFLSRCVSMEKKKSAAV